MIVDWLTVGAQILNFLVLVYLLKRFLYGPIVRAMARREAAIAARLAEAERGRQEAEAETRRLREAREGLEAKREQLLERAREEADALRRTLEQDVRGEMEATRGRWRAELDRERAVFLRDVRRHLAEQFTALARRGLADLASAELEAQMAGVLVERLAGLDDTQRTALARARAADEPLGVRSAFDLPAAVKRRLTTALHEVFGEDAEVRYEPADDVLCGIEVRAGGQSVAWSLEGYLDVLERQLGDGFGEITPRAREDGFRGA
jgi:F-type H+-transporting ATPase subunit b